LAHFVLITAVV